MTNFAIHNVSSVSAERDQGGGSEWVKIEITEHALNYATHTDRAVIRHELTLFPLRDGATDAEDLRRQLCHEENGEGEPARLSIQEALDQLRDVISKSRAPSMDRNAMLVLTDSIGDILEGRE